MKGIFLDDERVPSDVKWLKYPSGIEWVVVRNSQEFFEQFQKINPDIVSFDHDLQECDEHEVETTGYNILVDMLFICQDEKLRIPECVFHTMNPIGKEKMVGYLRCFEHFHSLNR